ncbi:MAG TPA: hypothetical protein VGW78_01020 [Candidatus Babeliales bacterium]|jgi:hypothetical protein|nr:hypothetical protein [Candidatus Babeliales bacterium]
MYTKRIAPLILAGLFTIPSNIYSMNEGTKNLACIAAALFAGSLLIGYYACRLSYDRYLKNANAFIARTITNPKNKDESFIIDTRNTRLLKVNDDPSYAIKRENDTISIYSNKKNAWIDLNLKTNEINWFRNRRTND